uniref:Secreted protein n=1 Tax=Ixodes ricinus TaxID=34613 RepID=A0A6B0UWL6_IXORI
MHVLLVVQLCTLRNVLGYRRQDAVSQMLHQLLYRDHIKRVWKLDQPLECQHVDDGNQRTGAVLILCDDGRLLVVPPHPLDVVQGPGRLLARRTGNCGLRVTGLRRPHLARGLLRSADTVPLCQRHCARSQRWLLLLLLRAGLLHGTPAKRLKEDFSSV